MTYSEAMTELEQIIQRFERGQIPLEEALTLRQRAQDLLAFTAKQLEALQMPAGDTEHVI